MNAHVLDSRREARRPEWARVIAADLDYVEEMLEAVVRSSDVGVASDLAMHLFSAGGKRLRPALVILSSRALAKDELDIDRLARLAVSTELVHTASLVHDDVIDETSERRGVSTANSRFGNRLSVLGGDFLLSKAFVLLARDGDPSVIHILSNVAVVMSESEMLQAESEGSLSAWEENYWRIIRGKTAAFISACCEAGSVAVGGAPEVCAAIAEYGMQIGLAFQVTDDVLDIAGRPDETGKEVGTDLVNGKFTLPFLLALKNAGIDSRRILLSAAQDGFVTREQAREIAEIVIAEGGVEQTREAAAECVRKARKKLELLPISEYRDALDALAVSIIDRNM